VLAKYEYEGKPNVQTVPDVLPQEELSADNKTVDKREYEKEPEVQYSTTTPDDQEELPADNENYKNTSQMGDEDEPTADLEGEKPNVRENPYSIDETNREEDVANNEQSNGVSNKKEPRGSP
jgi:hypothetical protein